MLAMVEMTPVSLKDAAAWSGQMAAKHGARLKAHFIESALDGSGTIGDLEGSWAHVGWGVFRVPRPRECW